MEKGIVDIAKISAVRTYLESEFPILTIDESYDRDRENYSFRIAQGGLTHLITITVEFLDFHSTEEIATFLRKWQLAENLRRADRSRVVVRTGGIQIENQ